MNQTEGKVADKKQGGQEVRKEGEEGKQQEPDKSKSKSKEGEREDEGEGEGERESELSQLAREYVKNLAKTVDNSLCGNIAKMQTLSKLNCAALDTYSKSYGALNQCLLDSNYDENKK